MTIDPGAWWREHAGLDGKVAVVTGGAGGLGEAITLNLLSNGVRVALVDRDEAAVSNIVATAARVTGLSTAALGDRLVAMSGDARESSGVDSLFDAALDRWHRVDQLVNVAGGTFKAGFTEQSPRAWDALMRANLTHVLHSSQRAVRIMRESGRGGSIVNITTIEAHRAAPNFAVYSAAKAAVAHFSRSLALEVARDGIRVNCVAPDLAPTPNMIGITGSADAYSPLRDEVAIGIGIPMGRVGVPDDIANSVVFLLSDLANYMTGTTLHPDGGTFASSGWFNWPDEGYANMPPERVTDLYRPNT